MRILVDGVFFQLASSGIARVWASVLPRLAARGNLEVFILDRGGSPAVEGATRIPFPSYRDRYTVDDSELLQKICDHYAIDVFTSTYYTSPISTPMLLLVYDMIPEVFDFDLSQRFWAEKEIAISFARRFIAISKSTKRDLQKFYPEILAQSVEVAYPGLDTSIFQPKSDPAIREYCMKIGYPRPYILLVGSREQHKAYKNSKLFFSACRSLGDVGFDILCVGGEKEIASDCRAMLPAEIRVKRIDASDSELALAYAGALALVYPSLYEGFGLPVIEAMACGCPVITTKAGSLGEIAIDGSCLIIDGKSEDEMKEALVSVRQHDTRSSLVTKGLKHAASFNWESMVETIERQSLLLHSEFQNGLFTEFFVKWGKLRLVQGNVDTQLIY